MKAEEEGKKKERKKKEFLQTGYEELLKLKK